MNTSKIKIYSIITAGGVSARFGSNKLLETLETKEGKNSVICTSIEKFLFCSEKIIIPCHSEVKNHIEKNMEHYVKTGKIQFADFGKTRQQSVFYGLQKCALNPPDIVLIHDGARPFVETGVIKETIEKLKTFKGVCVGVYAVDTIKITDKNGIIAKTVDRNTVFQAQTPQGFDFNTIFEAHKKLQDESFTDDSGMLEHLGIKVFALQGNISNKKITYREDLKNS